LQEVNDFMEVIAQEGNPAVGKGVSKQDRFCMGIRDAGEKLACSRPLSNGSGIDLC
jgi:hypothetical protein